MIWCTKDGIIVICKIVEEDRRHKFLIRTDQYDSKIYKFLMEEE